GPETAHYKRFVNPRCAKLGVPREAKWRVLLQGVPWEPARPVRTGWAVRRLGLGGTSLVNALAHRGGEGAGAGPHSGRLGLVGSLAGPAGRVRVGGRRLSGRKPGRPASRSSRTALIAPPRPSPPLPGYRLGAIGLA